MTVDEIGDWKPELQAKFWSCTFWRGLFEVGVRTPTVRPWSCPLTETRWKMACALVVAARTAGRKLVNFIFE